MKVDLTPEAKAELIDARDWYDAQSPGLGLRFMDEYCALAVRLADNPRQFPAVRRLTRRAGFHSFPYGLFFRIRGNAVEVFGCFHGKQDPRRWQRRAQ